MKFYHYPNCGTCKKAKSFLEAHNVSVTPVHIVDAPPTRAELADLVKRSGKPLSKFFNTSGQSYRDGDFKSRLPTMTEAQQLEALAADGKLIKRPILDLGERTLVGFTEAEWVEALK